MFSLYHSSISSDLHIYVVSGFQYYIFAYCYVPIITGLHIYISTYPYVIMSSKLHIYIVSHLQNFIIIYDHIYKLIGFHHYTKSSFSWYLISVVHVFEVFIFYYLHSYIFIDLHHSTYTCSHVHIPICFHEYIFTLLHFLISTWKYLFLFSSNHDCTISESGMSLRWQEFFLSVPHLPWLKSPMSTGKFKLCGLGSLDREYSWNFSTYIYTHNFLILYVSTVWISWSFSTFDLYSAVYNSRKTG